MEGQSRVGWGGKGRRGYPGNSANTTTAPVCKQAPNKTLARALALGSLVTPQLFSFGTRSCRQVVVGSLEMPLFSPFAWEEGVGVQWLSGHMWSIRDYLFKFLELKIFPC